MSLALRAQTPEEPEPGVYSDIEEDIYHASPGLSVSRIKSFMEVPARAFIKRKETRALRFGSVIHSVLLQPDVARRHYVLDDRNSNSKEYKAFEAEVKASGREVIRTKEWDEACRMRDAVMSQQAGRDLIRPGLMAVEQSFWWKDWETGLLCRGRADGVFAHPDWRILLDIKSTDDASKASVRNKIGEYGYDLQSVYYQEGMELALSQSVPRAQVWRPEMMVFLFIEKEPPYLCRPYKVGDDDLESSRVDIREALRAWKRCADANHFPGFPDMIEDVDVPEWARARRAMVNGYHFNEEKEPSP